MGLLSFCGYALIGLGPAGVLLCGVLRKPFLLIVVLASAFFWLLTLMTIGIPAQLLSLGGESTLVHGALVVLAVLSQEGFRWIYWRLCTLTERALDVLAERQSKSKLSVFNKLSIYLASGLGHGLAHSSMFFLALLTPTLGAATYYVDNCPEMPFFLAAALASLGFLVLHTFSMVIALDGYAWKKTKQVIYVMCLHLVAALLVSTFLYLVGRDRTNVSFQNEVRFNESPFLLLAQSAIAGCVVLALLPSLWEQVLSKSSDLFMRVDLLLMWKSISS